jgi:cold shock CspA family protein
MASCDRVTHRQDGVPGVSYQQRLERGMSTSCGPAWHGRTTEAHREVYFHANAVHGIPFEHLQVNMAVDLDIEAGHAGLQATRVTPRFP